MSMRETGVAHAHAHLRITRAHFRSLPPTQQARFTFSFSYFPLWATVLSAAQCLTLSTVTPNPGLPSWERAFFLNAVFFISPLALLLSNPPIKFKLKFPSSQLIDCEECNVVNGFTLVCK